MHDFHAQFIDGVWTPSSASERIALVNPATGEAFEWVPDGTPDDAARAVAAARAAFPLWAARPMQDRVALMRAMLERLRAKADDIVRLEVLELGSPEGFARSTHCDYQFARIESYIGIAEKLPLELSYPQSLVLREPLGVVACITPWNYPLGQVVQKVIPAVLMGNAVVLKPSQHTPLTAHLLMEAFAEAGFPKGVVNLVCGRGSVLGEALVRSPDVSMVSFTGSTRVGAALAAEAMRGLKRVSLELGGKSPFVWLEGMPDYEPAARQLLNSVLLNSGQTCTALSRLLVPRAMLPEVEALLIRLLPEYPVGDPRDPAVKVGPLASRAQYDKVRGYIKLGLEVIDLFLSVSLIFSSLAISRGLTVRGGIAIFISGVSGCRGVLRLRIGRGLARGSRRSGAVFCSGVICSIWRFFAFFFQRKGRLLLVLVVRVAIGAVKGAAWVAIGRRHLLLLL